MKPVTPKPCPECGGRRVVIKDHVRGGITMALPIPDSGIYLQQSQRSTGKFYQTIQEVVVSANYMTDKTTNYQANG